MQVPLAGVRRARPTPAQGPTQQQTEQLHLLRRPLVRLLDPLHAALPRVHLVEERPHTSPEPRAGSSICPGTCQDLLPERQLDELAEDARLLGHRHAGPLNMLEMALDARHRELDPDGVVVQLATPE